MISIIIPYHNEADNLPILLGQIDESMKNMKEDYEVVLVDDGSTEKTELRIKNATVEAGSRFGGKESRIKTIRHRTRMGKGEALGTGIKNASGEKLVFMDGDLQDDPSYIGEFIARLDEGYDFVNGIRLGRKHNVLLRAYSYLAEKFLKIFLQSPYTDINCGFKAMRREVVSNFRMYGNNFRFLPIYVSQKGYRITEVPVVNRKRRYGKTKFGISKVFIGLIDTINAYFLYQFSEKPLHFFGIIGMFFFAVGFLWAAYLSYERLFLGVLLYRRPALLLAILLIIVGIQIFLTGLIGELIVYLDKKKTA